MLTASYVIATAGDKQLQAGRGGVRQQALLPRPVSRRDPPPVCRVESPAMWTMLSASAAELLLARLPSDGEAAELEAAEKTAALEVPLSLRITRELDAELKRRAAAEQISPSALIRRILRQVLHSGQAPVLTVEQVEEIARRVMREPA